MNVSRHSVAGSEKVGHVCIQLVSSGSLIFTTQDPYYIQSRNNRRELANTMNEKKVEMDHRAVPYAPAQPSPSSMQQQRALSQTAVNGLSIHHRCDDFRVKDLVCGNFHDVLREYNVIGAFARNDGTEDSFRERSICGVDCHTWQASLAHQRVDEEHSTPTSERFLTCYSLFWEPTSWAVGRFSGG